VRGQSDPAPQVQKIDEKQLAAPHGEVSPAPNASIDEWRAWNGN